MEREISVDGRRDSSNETRDVFLPYSTVLQYPFPPCTVTCTGCVRRRVYGWEEGIGRSADQLRSSPQRGARVADIIANPVQADLERTAQRGPQHVQSQWQRPQR